MAIPAVSRRASIRGPILPTFPQAPLRSRTARFPRSGSDLGYPSWAFPVSRRSLSPDMRAPRRRWFAPDLVPAARAVESRLSVREPPKNRDRQAPRAPLPRVGVTSSRKACTAFWKGVAPSSSLVRTHAPDLLPSARLRHRLARPVFAGCRQPLLGTGPSRRYLCQSFPTCLDPYSGCSRGAHTRFFPQDIGLPRVRNGSAHRKLPTATSVGADFRSCSHSLIFRPAGLLATPVAPTSHLAVLGGRGFYIHAYHGPLPRRAVDMLSVQIRAIDGKRTFTSRDWQPCRLLP